MILTTQSIPGKLVNLQTKLLWGESNPFIITHRQYGVALRRYHVWHAWENVNPFTA
ncbi:hypothetical protein CJ030_MR7G001969 [Morella rubra]|uniref:Uncharacterized protein n=1 Tax=Morella rubra TaxID=262757 RepID=A0A6A1WSI0_9ROSI|nr:hypothetical protein CJ030_MR7G001969 [Morella rubra]